MSVRTVVVTSRSYASSHTGDVERLQAAGLTVVRCDPAHDPAQLAGPLSTATSWIAGTAPVTAELLELAPRLRVVARYGAGVDAVDLDAARRRGIWVTNTPGANSSAVADLSVALMLALLRRMIPAVEAGRRGDWTPRYGRELGAVTTGIVGFGRIGQAVARRLSGFGGRVIAYDPALTVSPLPGVELVGLDDLARQSTVVTLHASGASPIAGPDWLAQLPADAVLVNTARGGLVDEDAVATALRAGRLGGYATDALTDEHGVGGLSPLLAADLADRVVVTPHVASHTVDAIAQMSRMATDAVLAVRHDERPAHVVVEPAPMTPTMTGNQ